MQSRKRKCTPIFLLHLILNNNNNRNRNTVDSIDMIADNKNSIISMVFELSAFTHFMRYDCMWRERGKNQNLKM